MADFCLECWNKINKTNDSKRKYILSKDSELCEGCGEWKRVVVARRDSCYTYRSRYIALPISIIGCIVYLLQNLCRLIYSIFKRSKK